MANEIGWIWEWLDIGGQPRSDVNKVTEEAVQRIQEQSKKAQQTHQQIQQDKAKNSNLAQFLTFLLKTVQNDKIVSLLYDVFFKLKNPETGVTHFRKKINITIIVGFFYPFYVKEANKFGLEPLFGGLIQESNTMSFHTYIKYIKQLAMKYHDNVALDQHSLVKLLSEIITYYEVHGHKITDEEHEASIAEIKRELF